MKTRNFLSILIAVLIFPIVTAIRIEPSGETERQEIPDVPEMPADNEHKKNAVLMRGAVNDNDSVCMLRAERYELHARTQWTKEIIPLKTYKRLANMQKKYYLCKSLKCVLSKLNLL